MAAKLVELKNDVRVSPLRCAEVLVEELKSGKLKARRMMVVVEEESSPDLQIRGAGPGLDYLPTAVGLLHMAATDLAISGLPHWEPE